MLKLWGAGGGTDAVRLRVGTVLSGPLDPLDVAANLGVYCGGGIVSAAIVQVAVFVTVVSCAAAAATNAGAECPFVVTKCACGLQLPKCDSPHMLQGGGAPLPQGEHIGVTGSGAGADCP